MRSDDNSMSKILKRNVIPTGMKPKPRTYSVKDYVDSLFMLNGIVSMDDFDVYLTDDDVVVSTINKYLKLLDDPRYLEVYKLDQSTAVNLAYKIGSLTQHIYGDTRLYYIITLFNNIQSAADLSVSFLQDQGVFVLNRLGIEQLKLYKNKIRVQSAKATSSEVMGW